jgi:hypothetical protein
MTGMVISIFGETLIVAGDHNEQAQLARRVMLGSDGQNSVRF